MKKTMGILSRFETTVTDNTAAASNAFKYFKNFKHSDIFQLPSLCQADS